MDNLLQYEAWFAQEDIRWIHTGLGFGAVLGNELIKRILVAREERDFDAVANHAIDTPIIAEYLGLIQTKESKLYGHAYVVGMTEYGRYARHHGMGSWMPTEAKSILVKRGKNLALWKVKCWFRNPRFISRLERNGENRLSRLYVFCAYDLLDMGLMYFAKRLTRKIIKR